MPVDRFLVDEGYLPERVNSATRFIGYVKRPIKGRKRAAAFCVDDDDN